MGKTLKILGIVIALGVVGFLVYINLIKDGSEQSTAPANLSVPDAKEAVKKRVSFMLGEAFPDGYTLDQKNAVKEEYTRLATRYLLLQGTISRNHLSPKSQVNLTDREQWMRNQSDQMEEIEARVDMEEWPNVDYGVLEKSSWYLAKYTPQQEFEVR